MCTESVNASYIVNVLNVTHYATKQQLFVFNALLWFHVIVKVK